MRHWLRHGNNASKGYGGKIFCPKFVLHFGPQKLFSILYNLPHKYITQKILTVLGDADKVEEIMKRLQAEEIDRFSTTTPIEE